MVAGAVGAALELWRAQRAVLGGRTALPGLENYVIGVPDKGQNSGQDHIALDEGL